MAVRTSWLVQRSRRAPWVRRDGHQQAITFLCSQCAASAEGMPPSARPDPPVLRSASASGASGSPLFPRRAPLLDLNSPLPGVAAVWRLRGGQGGATALFLARQRWPGFCVQSELQGHQLLPQRQRSTASLGICPWPRQNDIAEIMVGRNFPSVANFLRSAVRESVVRGLFG